MENFNQELNKVEIPKIKYSKLVLNMRYVLESCIKTKKYSEAQEIKEKLK